VEKRKQAFADFIKGGKGFVGIHSATDTFYDWPEYGQMIGGYFDGHPWHEKVTLEVEGVDHPCNKCFEGKDRYEITDEIYQYKAEPYSRKILRVLTRLDVTKTNMQKGGIKRTDGDFGVSWVKTHGQGRVFQCSLGHREEIYWNPVVLKHYLAGIQFAIGDLKADATPSVK
jgi:type 1 glutamine amidotransferase